MPINDEMIRLSVPKTPTLIKEEILKRVDKSDFMQLLKLVEQGVLSIVEFEKYKTR